MRHHRPSASARFERRRITSIGVSLISGLALVAGFTLTTATSLTSSAPAGATVHSHALKPHTAPQTKLPANASHVQRPLLGAAPRLAAPAATFNVNTTNDTDDVNPGDGVCADSDGNCSIRAALEEANALGLANPAMGTTQVNVPANTYTLTMATSLPATDPAGLDIVGAGAGSTVIQQPASPTARVLTVSEASSTLGANVMLSGVTIQGGAASDDVGGGIAVADAIDLLQLNGVVVTGNTAAYGGGVYNDGQLWVTNSSIDHNTADDSGSEPYGGGLYDDNAVSLINTKVDNNSANSTAGNQAYGGGIAVNGSIVVQGGSISGNAAGSSGAYAYGGGMYDDGTADLSSVTVNNNTVTTVGTNFAQGGGIYADSQLDSITNSTISGNVASGYFGNGGGIAVVQSVAPVITNSTLDNNQANGNTDCGYGGAISTYDGSGGVDINNSTLSGNSANDASCGGYGGAVEAEGLVRASGSTFTNNTASGGGSCGGALYLDAGGNVTDTTIANNTVGTTGTTCGGGVYAWSSPWSLTRSTVSGNSANEGGGIYNDATLTAENSTIANNSTSGVADEGGGIYADDVINLSFVTVNGNTSSDGSAIYNNGQTGTIGSSIIQASCASGGVPVAPFTSAGHNVLGDATCVNPQSTDQVVANLGLSPLGNYGGPTQTEVPFSTSPAVGAGGTACPLTDQRGVNRPQGAACDSGAVEINQSYWMVASDGGIFTFGGAGFFGSMGGHPLNRPIVGLAAAPDGKGYWEVASDGGIFNFGASAGFYGSAGSLHLNKPVVGMAATPDGKGYWLVASDGGVFTYGDAVFHGSMGGHPLNKPVVGIAATPSGGYWEVASDGGIFSFGPGATFHGSAGSLHLNAPVVGIAASPDGGGYWTVASDGGIFNYGDAGFYGSTGAIHLNKPVVGMAGSPVGKGYWLAASDGGIFAFGDAMFQGSMGGIPLNKPVVGIAST